MRVGLPVEIVVRELDGKIWLGLCLLNESEDIDDVVIGKQSYIYGSYNTSDIDVVFKTSGISPRMDEFRENSGSVVFLDTEGGIFLSDKAYQKRVCPEPVSSVDQIFAWGKKPAEIVTSGVEKSINVTVTGNPRFDLLFEPQRAIYQERSEEFNSKYGEYILINTNFSSGNPESGNLLMINNSDEEHQVSGKQDWQVAICEKFVQATKSIDESISNKVILRPHPSENHETYRNAFKKYEDISVVHEGDVRPWILGASAVVHNGCTTGIESALMETPTISYEPFNENYGPDLPNEVSIRTSSEDELIDEIKKHKGSTYEISNEGFDRLNQYINVDGRSVDKICDALSEVDAKYDGGFKTPLREKLKYTFTGIVGDQNITRLRSTGLKEGWQYSNRAFSYMSTEEFKDRVDKINEYVGYEELSVDRFRCLENTFLLS